MFNKKANKQTRPKDNWSTLRTMHPLKAPRADGFHAHFYQHNWDIMGSDISRFIETIFITARIPEDLTRIKLVLIPKTPNPETVSHLRPISLCNTLYELFTKILVNTSLIIRASRVQWGFFFLAKKKFCVFILYI